jgi:hypothetical protein
VHADQLADAMPVPNSARDVYFAFCEPAQYLLHPNIEPGLTSANVERSGTEHIPSPASQAFTWSAPVRTINARSATTHCHAGPRRGPDGADQRSFVTLCGERIAA